MKCDLCDQEKEIVVCLDCYRQTVKNATVMVDRQYEWASIINRLAVIAMAEEVSSNDRDYAQDAIDMVIPYLGLNED